MHILLQYGNYRCSAQKYFLGDCTVLITVWTYNRMVSTYTRMFRVNVWSNQVVWGYKPLSPDIISTIAKEFSSCFCSACFAYSLSMFDTLVFAGSPNKDFFKHTRLWSLIKTYFSSSGMSTLNLQVSASSSIDSDNRALLFVRAKGSCSTDDVDSSSPENRGSIPV